MKTITPRFETITDKKLIGLKKLMSFTNFEVAELWARFLVRRQEIINRVSPDMISVAIYPSNHFSSFLPTNIFEKWAAVEVSNFDSVPSGMTSLVLPGGLYAVFDYKGASTDASIFKHIYNTWLPNSGYHLDDRPHFEILGDRYKNNNPSSEEEIWIPITTKR